jgi:hypothetical protein
VFSNLKKNRTTFLCHNLGFAFWSFASYGMGAWRHRLWSDSARSFPRAASDLLYPPPPLDCDRSREGSWHCRSGGRGLGRCLRRLVRRPIGGARPSRRMSSRGHDRGGCSGSGGNPLPYGAQLTSRHGSVGSRWPFWVPFPPA